MIVLGNADNIGPDTIVSATGTVTTSEPQQQTITLVVHS